MYEVIPNIIQTFLIAIEAMYLATLLIIPDLKSVLIIISTMFMILVSLVATLSAWGVQASSIVKFRYVSFLHLKILHLMNVTRIYGQFPTTLISHE